MTIRDAIEGRRSIRKYKRQSIRREVLYDVLWSGMLAPNANNSQDWFFISIEERARIESLEGAIKEYMAQSSTPSTGANSKRDDYHPLFEAPAVILVCGKTDNRWSDVDCALAAGNISLAALDRNLGSCIVGFPGTLYRDDAYRHHFDGYAIPEGFEVKFAMTLGYPDESPAPRPRDVRKIVYYD